MILFYFEVISLLKVTLKVVEFKIILYLCFKNADNNEYISAWKSIGLPEKGIETPATSNDSFSPVINYINADLRVKFDENFLKEHKVIFNHKIVVNTNIAYEINLRPFQSADITLRSSLFGTVKVTMNAEFDKYN